MSRSTAESSIERSLKEALRCRYGVTGALERLDGEFDLNFSCRTASAGDLIVKVMHAGCEPDLVAIQCEALQRIRERYPRARIPDLVPTLDGEQSATLLDPAGEQRIVWMMTRLPGKAYARCRPRPARLVGEIGRAIAELHEALVDLDHPLLEREMKWDLRYPGWIRQHLDRVSDQGRRDLLAGILDRFDQLEPQLRELPSLTLHNDVNDYNLIVEQDAGATYQLRGLIDFGDMLKGPAVCELAIAGAYLVLDERRPFEVLAGLVGGYHRLRPLSGAELEMIFPLLLTRLAVSVVNAAMMKIERPDDPYVSVTEGPAWEFLERFARTPAGAVTNCLRLACGLPGVEHEAGSAAAAGHVDLDIATLEEAIDLRLYGTSGGDAQVRLAASGQAGAQHVATMREKRARLFGGNLKLSYREPVTATRGWKHFLFDADGDPYLDAYNNVPHVGHCHPRIVEAATRQAKLLSTNTRYLHPAVIEYAERLVSKLPAPLEVCYFVNSASEANELALRLARTATGARDTIVMEQGYHGNTTTTIDISAYKFNGRGAAGPPDWVHVVPLADPYRGAFRRNDPDAGARYAAAVEQTCARLEGSGRKLAAFICESLPSVGGQIVFPPGYLEAAYAAVRAAGGCCIADEVQTGLGRLGEWFWGFESQGVVPDIVVLGKPLGNGHPIGAVVTSRRIADAFDNGMEFFSTFGGNTVSAAVGLEVLKVIEDESLQAHARAVGAGLRARFDELARAQPIIGDVRGFGLFWGIELVKNRESLQPATKAAHYVVNRLREEHILAGTEGRFDNILKVRPPMTFDERAADHFTSVLAQILQEDFIAAQLSGAG